MAVLTLSTDTYYHIELITYPVHLSSQSIYSPTQCNDHVCWRSIFRIISACVDIILIGKRLSFF